MEKKNDTRPRDARGRFVKREATAPTHVITEKEITRIINRIADGGEPTEESMRIRSIIITYIIHICFAIGAFALLLLIVKLFK